MRHTQDEIGLKHVELYNVNNKQSKSLVCKELWCHISDEVKHEKLILNELIRVKLP